MRAQAVAFVRPHRRRPAPAVHGVFKKVGRLRYSIPDFKREFDYTLLADLLRSRIATALAEAHVAYLTRFAKDTAMARYHAVRHLAESIIANPPLARRLKRCGSLKTGIGAQLWRQAVAERVVALERRKIELTTFAEEIGALFVGLDELASLGLSATCERPVLPKNYHASGGRRPGLLEQSSKLPVAPQVLAQLEAHIDALKLPIEGKEAHALLRALAAQVPVEVLHDDVAVAEAIFNLNAKVLADVRRAAEETFLYWRDVWHRGQALLARADGTAISKAIREARKLPKHLANAPRRALLSPELGEEAVGNFLALINDEYGPVVPAKVERGWPIFMKEAYWELGGRQYFDACFSLHRAGVAAAVLLYLADSGANVSAALSLTTKSEQPTDDPAYVTFVSFKDRAGRDPIIKQLALKEQGVKVTAAQALRDVRLMTRTRRDMYPDILGEALFVHTFFSKPSPLREDVLADNFRYMLRNRQLPEVWTPSAIRIAVAVEVSGNSPGDLARVGRAMSHAVGSTATPIYALRFAVQLVLTRKIREYQTLLEVAFATNANSGPAFLGYSRNVADFLVSKAKRTGLGFLCQDATARGGVVGTNGEASCPDLGKSCAGCHVRVFMVDQESLSEIVAVHQSLYKKLAEYEEVKQEAWIDNWLELYAFASAVIQQAKRSRFAYLMPQAERKAKRMLEAGFDVFLLKE